MDLIFALTYHWLQRRVTQFGATVAERLTEQVTALCVVLVTIWVLVQGYRVVTGASREPAMVLVSRMIKVSLIVFAARTVAVSGTELYTFLNTSVPQEISYVVSGNDDSDMVDKIDQNLLKVSAATSLIDMVQVPDGDIALAREKSRATWMATIGIAAPAISAGALLLFYQIAMAMLLGMAPFFILCLVFDRTKDLFRRWLMYWLGTLFSMAMLSVVVTWVLTLTLNIAKAIWITDTLVTMTGQNAQGFNTIALQQGGIGLLMTVLIISTPPMAAALFQGTLGTFLPFAAFGAGAVSRRRARASNAPAQPAAHASPPDHGDPQGTPPLRHVLGTSTPQHDVIKRQPSPESPHPSGMPALSDEAMARAAYGNPRSWLASVGGAGSADHGPLFNTGRDYLDNLLGDAAYLANQNRQAQLNLAQRGQNGHPLHDSEVEQAWASITHNLPDAIRQIANDRSLSFQQRYDQSARLPGDVAFYLDQWHLTHAGNDGRTTDHVAALVAKTEAYQKQYGLFDPKRSTLIASSPEEAGQLLRQLLGNNDIESLNPSDTGGQTMQSTLPISQSGEAERAGFEVIGTIQITDPHVFGTLMQAYGLHVQQQNGGYDADALDTVQPGSSGPFATSEPNTRGFAVAQGLLDAASLAADIKSRSEDLRNIGTITVMEHEGKKYFEYVEHSYRQRGANPPPVAPPMNSKNFQAIEGAMKREE